MCFRFLILVLALVGSLFSVTSVACSWEGLHPSGPKRLLAEYFLHHDDIVHGRVIAVKSNTATIEVMRSFKGQRKQIIAKGSVGFCGYIFRLGEEKIFFLQKGEAWVGGVYPPDFWLISQLNLIAAKK